MRAIVVMGPDNGIAYKGEIPYVFQADRERFKRMTMGYPIVMGAKTFLSLPNQEPLPGRYNLVISSSLPSRTGMTIFRQLKAFLGYKCPNAWVIGGESIYNQLLPYCSEVYATVAKEQKPADQFFPSLVGWHTVMCGETDEFTSILYRR